MPALRASLYALALPLTIAAGYYGFRRVDRAAALAGAGLPR